MKPRVAVVKTLAITAIALCATSISAQEKQSKSIEIDRPYAMATAPGQPHGAVFFHHIENKSPTPDQLIGGRTKVSKSVEVHRMDVENNVMRMREISAIDLPAKTKVALERGNKNGYHLMLMNLNAPLKVGDKFPMTLIFKNAGEIDVTVSIEKAGMHGHGGHKH